MNSENDLKAKLRFAYEELRKPHLPTLKKSFLKIFLVFAVFYLGPFIIFYASGLGFSSAWQGLITLIVYLFWPLVFPILVVETYLIARKKEKTEKSNDE